MVTFYSALVFNNSILCLFLGRVVLDWLLPVDIDSISVVPLRPLNADYSCMHPGSPYAVVGGPYHCDGKPTPEISTCSGVGFMTLGGKVAV